MVTARSRALTMPEVMVNRSSPMGLPTAYSVAHGHAKSLSPKVTALQPVVASISGQPDRLRIPRLLLWPCRGAVVRSTRYGAVAGVCVLTT